MIVRGTTPYHSFILPVLVEEIDIIWVTYCQNDEVIFERSNLETDENMELVPYTVPKEKIEEVFDSLIEGENEGEEEETVGSKLTLHLKQEETLTFTFYPAARKNTAIIQIRILTTDGEAYASEPIKERIFGLCHEGVISHEIEGAISHETEGE